MPEQLKTTYAGYLTIPTSTSAPLVDSNDTTIGGDIVKNFKAIGDLLKKQGANGIILDSSSNNTIASGVNGTVIGSDYSNSSGNRAVVLGSSNAESIIPYSVNTIDNRQNQLINGITGIKGVSYADTYGTYELDLDIPVDTAEEAIFDIDAIYVHTDHTRSMASYRVFVNSTEGYSVTLLGGTDSYASTRFTVSSTHFYLHSNYEHIGIVANIRYTILRNENFPTSSAISGSWGGSWS